MDEILRARHEDVGFIFTMRFEDISRKGDYFSPRGVTLDATVTPLCIIEFRRRHC